MSQKNSTSGLYSLILSSKLPSAKEFKHWVTAEVLPSIRKNGAYIRNQENLIFEFYSNFIKKLVDCLEKCLICRHIRRFAD